MHDIKPRLARCFQAVFPQMTPEEILRCRQENTEKWDSLATATLFGVIEEEFGVELNADELQNLDSFTNIADVLTGRMVAFVSSGT